MRTVALSVSVVTTIKYRGLQASAPYVVQQNSPVSFSVVRTAVVTRRSGVAELFAHHLGRVQVEEVIADGSPLAADRYLKATVVSIRQTQT